MTASIVSVLPVPVGITTVAGFTAPGSPVTEYSMHATHLWLAQAGLALGAVLYFEGEAVVPTGEDGLG